MSESNHTGPVMVRISQCDRCKHKYGGKQACPAYPDGIPSALYWNEHDHRKPYKGDQGIRFQPKKNLPEGAQSETSSKEG